MSARRHDLELVYPRELVTRPLLCDMARRHPGVVFNLHRASISRAQGTLSLELLGELESLRDAEAWLREQGLGVRVIAEGEAEAPPPEPPEPAQIGEGGPEIERKLWLTFGADVVNRPLLWQAFWRFGFDFDVRQASIRRNLGILGLQLRGPEARLEAACDFWREAGVEVEPIEKSIIEG